MHHTNRIELAERGNYRRQGGGEVNSNECFELGSELNRALICAFGAK